MKAESDAEADDAADDPFTKHLHFDLGDELLVSLSNSPMSVDNFKKTWSVLGNMSIVIPKPLQTVSKKVRPKVSILEDKTYANTGTVPHIINNIDFNQLSIKSQIQGNIVSANKTNLIKRDLELSEVFTPLQKELFAIMNNYQDLYYPERTFNNADEIRYTYCLHVVNHMLKTRTKILHHNAKLSKKNDNMSDEYRDQGLVRPKVRKSKLLNKVRSFQSFYSNSVVCMFVFPVCLYSVWYNTLNPFSSTCWHPFELEIGIPVKF